MTLNSQAQLKLRNCDINILCASPTCCSSTTNTPLPYDVINTWNGKQELITNKCKNCGTITKVTIEIKAEIIGDIKEYVPGPKSNSDVPKSDKVHSNICMTCLDYKIARVLYSPCDDCRHSTYCHGYGEDHYRRTTI